MTQGFALHCVATGSAYKMIWTAMQRRNRKNFYSCVASPSKSFYMYFRSRCNAAQPLRHIINQPLSTCTSGNGWHYIKLCQAWEIRSPVAVDFHSKNCMLKSCFLHHGYIQFARQFPSTSYTELDRLGRRFMYSLSLSRFTVYSSTINSSSRDLSTH